MISLYSSAIRTHTWMQIYENVQDSPVETELIFVGHKRPDFELPANFKYIYSTVKPAQCFHIAAMEASGEYIMPITDDIMLTPGALGYLKNTFEMHDDEKLIVTPQYYGRGNRAHPMRFTSRSHLPHPTSSLPRPRLAPGPIMPIGMFMKRKMYFEVGGIDKRFIALFWDFDLAMRVYQIGGRVQVCEKVHIREFLPQSLARTSDRHDKKLFQHLWYEPAQDIWVVRKIRLDGVESFESEDLMVKTQGTKGKWG